MASLNNIVKPTLLEDLKEVASSVTVPNSSLWYDYELLNKAIDLGYLNIAHFLVDRNCKVNKQSESNSPASTPLHHAVNWNHPPLVKKLLEQHSSITAIDTEHNTPLHLAFFLQSSTVHDIIVDDLMATSNYANVKNTDGLTHLHIAAARGNTVAVQKFLEAGANISDVVLATSPAYGNYSALRFACDSKSLETLKVILRARQFTDSYNEQHFQNLLAEKSFQESIRSVIVRLHYVILDPRYRTPQRLSDFHLACISFSPKKVKEFLDRGLTPNFSTSVSMRFCPLYTALHFAIESDTYTYDKVELLLEYGANVELQNGYSMTPLHLAFYYSDYRTINDTVKLLYNAVKNKKANLMDANGLTYFHVAVAMNDFAAVETFLKLGVDVNQAVLPNLRNFANYTPLHFAVKYRHPNMAKLLIERGANVNVAVGMTPLQMACEAGHTGLMELLIGKGASANIVCAESGKTLLHLFVDNAVDCNENLFYLCKKRESRPEDVRLWMRKLVAFVDVDAQDRQGNTVLHTVCSKLLFRSRFARDLLWYGADVNVRNEDGHTPFELAINSRVRGSYDELLVLYHHVRKLEALGLPVDERNERCCEMLMRKKYEWYVVCKNADQRQLEARLMEMEKEIEMMKGVKLAGGELSMFEFLRMDVERAAKYMVEVVRLIRDVDCRKNFRLYGYLPYLQCKRCFKWLREKKRVRESDTLMELSAKLQEVKRPRYQ